jgi:hypothetical protein
MLPVGQMTRAENNTGPDDRFCTRSETATRDLISLNRFTKTTERQVVDLQPDLLAVVLKG